MRLIETPICVEPQREALRLAIGERDVGSCRGDALRGCHDVVGARVGGAFVVQQHRRHLLAVHCHLRIDTRRVIDVNRQLRDPRFGGVEQRLGVLLGVDP